MPLAHIPATNPNKLKLVSHKPDQKKTTIKGRVWHRGNNYQTKAQTEMLYLCTLSGKTLPLPYERDMPRWQYLAEILAPSAGYTVVDGTVFEHILSKGELWSMRNKFDRIGDILADGDSLHIVLPFGRYQPIVYGNACDVQGDASGCGICHSPSVDTAYECLHFFHYDCVRSIDSNLCPICCAPAMSTMPSVWDRCTPTTDTLPTRVPKKGTVPFY